MFDSLQCREYLQVSGAVISPVGEQAICSSVGRCWAPETHALPDQATALAKKLCSNDNTMDGTDQIACFDVSGSVLRDFGDPVMLSAARSKD